jgi:hypothetical protein
MSGLFSFFKKLFRGQRHFHQTDAFSLRYIDVFRECGRLHYVGRGLDFTLNCEWLGWGPGQKMFLTTSFSCPEPLGKYDSYIRTNPETLSLVVQDLNEALTAMGMRYVIYRHVALDEIPMEERKRAKQEYADYMLGHGIKVTYNEDGSRTEEAAFTKDQMAWVPEQLQGMDDATALKLSIKTAEIGDYILGYRVKTEIVGKSADITPEELG